MTGDTVTAVTVVDLVVVAVLATVVVVAAVVIVVAVWVTHIETPLNVENIMLDAIVGSLI